MAEYIEREEIMNRLFTEYATDSKADVFELIRSIPATEVQTVKRGRWYHINNEGFIYCSECQNEAYWDTDYGQQLFDYCPYCGAKMKKP